jgi:autotransporter-associated beta strand protein
VSGFGFLGKSAAGTLTFAGTSTFNGTISINAGTLRVGAANALTANNLNVNAGATFDVAHSTAVNSVTGPGAIAVASGENLTLKSSAPLNSVISGAGGVIFLNNNQSNGVSTIGSDQTYTGLTTVGNGTVNLGNGTASGFVAGDIFLASSSSIVNFTRGLGSDTYAGVVSGSGQLRKNNSGTLTLTGANSYTGNTVVNNGTLRVGAANTLPTGSAVFLTGSNAAKLDVANDQTVAGFANSFDNSGIFTSFGSIIDIALGKVFDVTLGNRPTDTFFAGAITGDGAFEIGPSAGAHSVTLFGANTYRGGTTIDTGGTLTLATLFDNQSTPNPISSGTLSGEVVDNGVLVFQLDESATLNGRISGNGKVSLGTAAGNGGREVRLTAANTYTGGTDVYSGDLFAMNTSGSATGTGDITMHAGVLAGTGSISGHVNLLAGANIAPAADLGFPSTLTIGSADFAGGSGFIFQINDANGVSGVNLSLLNLTGALNFGATASDPFSVKLRSIDGRTSMDGALANFDPAQAYRWLFLTAGAGITNFSSLATTVDLSYFSTFNRLNGSFGVSQSGNSLFLEYTPAAVPEPSTWALLSLGAGLLLLGSRRRRRAKR